MKPTYVTFEQAKRLKEIGLVAECKRYWVKYSNSEYKEMSAIQLEDLDREIGIGGNLIIPKYEQWQIIEWLRVKYEIWISCHPTSNPLKCQFRIYQNNKGIMNQTYDNYMSKEFITPQQAYSAAFDYILQNNLI
jgi:hypothetical protein